MKKYAVMGNPIAHSKSPELHQAFAKQFSLPISYERILVPLNGLEAALKKFYADGGHGVNVTLPFKEDAYRLMSKLSEPAQHIQAVNTITFLSQGEMQGDNTDGIGFLRDLENKKIPVKNQQIAIIGVGGASRSILWSLLKQAPKTITLINRNKIKAEKLQQEYLKWGHLQVSSFEEAQDKAFDLVINATSAGTKGEILNLPENLMKGSICYDLAYGAGAIAFLNGAKDNGAAACFDGWGMLVEQAAEAFYIWHGTRPETRHLFSETGF